MDPINITVTGLTEMFHKRMADFEAQLKKAPPSSSSTLATDFAAFRELITQALSNLQHQVELLARNIDSMEMRGRRGILLLHGVSEKQNEDAAQVVCNLVRDRLQIDCFTVDDIKRCHRLGKSSSNRTRPILCKFRDVTTRNKVWFEKTKLKSTSITISEFLTKPRHDLFMAARRKFGVTRCWTKDGTVYVLTTNGTRLRVTSAAQLHGLEPQEAAESAAQRTTSSRSRRTAANKK